jgi:hypothetical protein
MSLATLPQTPPALDRDSLWQHGRNGLSIARLLHHDGRPAALVGTACALAVESACRAALAQAGLFYDGDVRRGLARLAAPHDLWPPFPEALGGEERLAAAERAVAWIASYLRSEAPEHAWGY